MSLNLNLLILLTFYDTAFTRLLLLLSQFKLLYYVFQQKIKPRVYAPVLVTIWIAVPLFSISMACLSTDIINGVCVPYAIYSGVSYAIFIVEYVVPLALMIFCYSRIVYVLRFKVTTINKLTSDHDGCPKF